jgi:DNA uptake protein ComE-like DNA-binding protein
MELFYWLSLFVPILFMVLAGLFIRSHKYRRELVELSVCQTGLQENHAYLCGKRIPITSATLHELARVTGVSRVTGRRIRDFVRAEPQATINDIENLAGIGPKTMAVMREHFY